MGILRTLLLGRKNGIRARIGRRLGCCSKSEDASASAVPTPPTTPVVSGEKAVGLQPEAPRDVVPPEGFEVVLHKDALAAGSVVEVIIAGTAIAVANVGGNFYATTNTCPHAGGPLGEGTLEGSVLTCPYHGWQYDVAQGRCLTNPDLALTTYEVAIEGSAVCVRL